MLWLLVGGGGGGVGGGYKWKFTVCRLSFPWLIVLFGKLGSFPISICRWLKRTRDLVDLQAQHQAIFTDFSMCVFVVWRNHRRICHIQV